MEKFTTAFFGYLIGAFAIHWFCINFLVPIPLIEHRAIGIRNFLCIIWLIIIVATAISMPSNK